MTGVIEPGLDPAWIARIVTTALDEDLGPAPGRDVTTQSTIPPETVGAADLVARQDGVVAGLVVVPEVVAQVAARLGLPVPTVDQRVPDGTRVVRGDVPDPGVRSRPRSADRSSASPRCRHSGGRRAMAATVTP